MGMEIATIEPVALPDLHNPAVLPSLPAWLRRRTDALGSAVQPDSNGKHRTMAVLPQNLILNSSERLIVDRHIDALKQMLELSQPIELREKILTNAQAIGVMIASLLVKGGGAKLDKASADALTEDYLDALEDLPAWSVREATRKWNRGESQRLDAKPHDFNWRPTPPTLRRLSQVEMTEIRSRILKLEQLSNAVPLLEFSDEHRADMLKRLQAEVIPILQGKKRTAE